MEKYKYSLILSYDGTNYYGYQRQSNVISIQETLEKAFKNMTSFPIETFASSRTDRGVHAEHQVVHFETHLKIDEKTWQEALNRRLPEDIRVKKVKKVSPDFHARHDAKSKVYHYVFSKKPLTAFNYRYQIFMPNLDFNLIKEAVKKIEGTHDFTAFSQYVEGRTPVKNIFKCEIKETKNQYIFIIHGDNFLKYMVRSIVGTLIEIGLGRKKIDVIDQMFETKNRKLAGKTAPAKGLVLKKIYY
ncbi:MAG: tRNA pseudouridine(38-40) synthase TruA [Candidatus Phytoplasma sp.]|nr:tRNA pseudouridine(38-40) synthase TruA [Phytoplasma sp.]